MHWLTAIFGFIAIYCIAGFVYTLTQGPLPLIQTGLWVWGVGAIVFACAAPLNQRYRNAKNRTKEG